MSNELSILIVSSVCCLYCCRTIFVEFIFFSYCSCFLLAIIVYSMSPNVLQLFQLYNGKPSLEFRIIDSLSFLSLFFILSFYQSCMFIQLTLSGTNNIHIHTYKYNANGVFYSFVFKCNDFIRNTTFYKMLYTSRHNTLTDCKQFKVQLFIPIHWENSELI